MPFYYKSCTGTKHYFLLFSVHRSSCLKESGRFKSVSECLSAFGEQMVNFQEKNYTSFRY